MHNFREHFMIRSSIVQTKSWKNIKGMKIQRNMNDENEEKEIFLGLFRHLV